MASNETAEAAPPPVFTPPALPDPLPVDRSYQADVIACCVICCLISTVFVGLRFYTRRILLNVLGWEDCFILLSLIFSFLTNGYQIYEAALGLGLHWWLVKPENIVPMARAGWFTILWYQFSMAFVKVSIMMLYLRIWTAPWVRRAAWALLVMVLLYFAFDLAIVFTNCIPLQASWDFVTPGYCHPKSYWWAITSLNIVFDFMIFALPIPIIFTMTCARGQKILLYLLFSFGFFASFISCIRVYWLVKTATSVDVPFDYVPIATWTAIETNSAIVVACLMTLKPFLSRHLPMLLGSSGPGDSSGEKEHVDAGHRILTIGSKPTRIPQRRSWEVFHSRTGPEETDLEDAGHQPMESDATLEAVKGSVSSASKCMEDTTTIPNG